MDWQGGLPVHWIFSGSSAASDRNKCKARYKRGLIGKIAIRIEHILIYKCGAHNILET